MLYRIAQMSWKILSWSNAGIFEYRGVLIEMLRILRRLVSRDEKWDFAKMVLIRLMLATELELLEVGVGEAQLLLAVEVKLFFRAWFLIRDKLICVYFILDFAIATAIHSSTK